MIDEESQADDTPLDQREEYAFYHETCGTCLYFIDIHPECDMQLPICRFWVPTATTTTFPSQETRIRKERMACAQWKFNPFLQKDNGQNG